MPNDESNWLELRSDALVARIDPLGAQLSVLQDAQGRDLLWNGDPAVWKGRAPILFPIVGELANGQFTLGSRSYALSRHGFARGKLFRTVTASADSVLLRLEADAATLAVYPFHFQLDIAFAVRGATLSLVAGIHNVGREVMPASFGWHPAFRWPLPYGEARDAHFVEFAQDEPAPVRRLDSAGLLLPERQPTPIEDRRLLLADALFRDDALILDQVHSRSVSFGGPAGPRVVVAFPDMPYLGLWMKPGAQFLCIEPWHGLADPQGYSGDFMNKPGSFQVEPGQSRTLKADIELVPSPV